jgi:hypothetical protein
MKPKLLIVGDSFSVDWSKKYSDVCGWVNLLNNDFIITNLSEAGVSEYKIYNQLKSIDTTLFDKILISHTSPYRIPIEEHPIHKKDKLHYNCDLIFSDVEEHLENEIMKTAYDFYTQIFHKDYFIFVNNLIFNEIKRKYPLSTHITFFDTFYDNGVFKFENIFKKYKGNVNHLNQKGNQIIYTKIIEILKSEL